MEWNYGRNKESYSLWLTTNTIKRATITVFMVSMFVLQQHTSVNEEVEQIKYIKNQPPNNPFQRVWPVQLSFLSSDASNVFSQLWGVTYLSCVCCTIEENPTRGIGVKTK